MNHEYGQKYIGMAFGEHRLFFGFDADWDARWEPSEPEADAVLWRYMSFAKFCSLLERREMFFSLVGDMEDRYEGFINPPPPRDRGNRLFQQEQQACDYLQKITRSALICCWTGSDAESALMWNAYAGEEGVAICTTFRDFQDSLPPPAELPVAFGRVEYADYLRQDVPRFCWAPLFHKRAEYRGEEEVRAMLPGPLRKPVDPLRKS